MEALNENQQRAVEHDMGPMLVLAGPGSGKTTVIIHRVQHLIENKHVSPESILVITFTKAAATQMQERFLEMSTGVDGVLFGTFHSLFFRILRRHGGYTLSQVMSEDETWKVLRGIIHSLQVQTNDEEEYIKSFLLEHSLMKSELIVLKQYHPLSFPEEEFYEIAKRYEAYKRDRKRLDFDDMLTKCYALLSEKEIVRKACQERFSEILVDEFQDINRVQYECLRLLAMPRNHLFAVGDDDQSIYRFRGARPSFMLDFMKDFTEAKQVTLNINYRSTDRIITLSERVISNNEKRYPKGMQGVRGTGKKIIFHSLPDTSAEAEDIADAIQKLKAQGIPFDQMAVLYRTNLQGGAFAKTLYQQGIPYIWQDKGINLYSHWITRDILSYLRLACNEGEDEALARIINKPKRYISKELLADARSKTRSLLRSLFLCRGLQTWQSKRLVLLQEHLEKVRRLSPQEAIRFVRETIGYDGYLEEYAFYRKASFSGFLEMAEELTQAAKGMEDIPSFLLQIDRLEAEVLRASKQGNVPHGPSVTLSTIHSAKGLEFEAVFVPGLIEGVLPHEKSKAPEELEEERRLFYVGITRAKSWLYLSEVKKKYDQPAERSRFLQEIGLRA